MRLASIAAPLLAVALLAGCGGSGKKSNGEAAKTADQIVADAQAAVRNATSVRFSGSAGADLVVNLHLAADKGGEGRITANGLTFDIVRIDGSAYFKGDAKFWRRFGGAAAATLFNGRWLKAPATSGRLASLTPLTDIDQLFNAIFSSHGKLEVGKETTINGKPAIGVVDTEEGGTMFVATTGKPYPLGIRKTGSGSIIFDEWDEPVKLAAPKGAVDISQLKP